MKEGAPCVAARRQLLRVIVRWPATHGRVSYIAALPHCRIAALTTSVISLPQIASLTFCQQNWVYFCAPIAALSLCLISNAVITNLLQESQFFYT